MFLIYLVKITGRQRWFVSNEHTGWLLCAMKCIRYWIKVDKYVNRENLLLLCSYLKQICRDISALVILIETNWAHHFWFLWYRTWMNFSVVRQVLNIFLIKIFRTQSHTWSFTLKKLWVFFVYELMFHIDHHFVIKQQCILIYFSISLSIL